MAASQSLPFYDSLDQIYTNLTVVAQQGPRWNDLVTQFAKRFGNRPSHIVRAPGRVNLIGEHIDYALFGVFPAAVERDILMAIGPSHLADGTVKVENLDQNYPGSTLNAEKSPLGEWTLPIDKKKLAWDSYVKAGYLGVLNHFFKQEGSPQACNILVHGTIPAGSGLSSSAAMVVASSLSFLLMNNRIEKMNKGSLVELAMENERRVGVNSGGMDQAASVIPEGGSALYITFHPQLAAEPVPIPASANPDFNPVFVIANSLIISDKAVSAKTQYNLRVVETLVAARVLAHHLGVEVGTKEKVTLREVLDRWIGHSDAGDVDPPVLKDGLGRILRELDILKAKDTTDGEVGLTMKEMISTSGLSDEQFNELYLSWVEVEATHFQLYKRAKHVYSEALRVLQFRDICLKDSGDIQSAEPLKEIGAQMNDSQESCASQFECSCLELDNLVSLARAAGAFGSRLTGAGWGGCSISVVAESHVESFITQLRKTYAPYRELSEVAFREAVFATKPGTGACVYKVQASEVQ